MTPAQFFALLGTDESVQDSRGDLSFLAGLTYG